MESTNYEAVHYLILLHYSVPSPLIDSYNLQLPLLKHTSLRMRDQVSHPYRTTGKLTGF